MDDGKDDFDSDEHETHATILDKLLAWEKKLYDEVKVSCSLWNSLIFPFWIEWNGQNYFLGVLLAIFFVILPFFLYI